MEERHRDDGDPADRAGNLRFPGRSRLRAGNSKTLTVSTTAGGKVTGPGIDCGNGASDCTEAYPVSSVRVCENDPETGVVVCRNDPVYQEVTLTATTLSGFRFQGWGGACSGSGTQNTCALTMNDNYSVSASWAQLYANGRIAYEYGGDIFSMNPDGTGEENLTNTAAAEADATYASDGSKIAFTSDRNGTLEAYVMNADGTGQTRLVNADYPSLKEESVTAPRPTRRTAPGWPTRRSGAMPMAATIIISSSLRPPVRTPSTSGARPL